MRGLAGEVGRDAAPFVMGDGGAGIGADLDEEAALGGRRNGLHRHGSDGGHRHRTSRRLDRDGTNRARRQGLDDLRARPELDRRRCGGRSDGDLGRDGGEGRRGNLGGDRRLARHMGIDRIGGSDGHRRSGIERQRDRLAIVGHRGHAEQAGDLVRRRFGTRERGPLHDALIDVCGGEIDRDHRLGFLPATGQGQRKSEVLAGLGVGTGGADRGGQHLDRTRRVAGQRHGEAAVARVDAVGMGGERLAGAIPVTGRNLRQREVERGLAAIGRQAQRIAKGVTRRGEAAGLEIGLAKHQAVIGDLGTQRHRGLGERDGGVIFALAEQILRLVGAGESLLLGLGLASCVGVGQARAAQCQYRQPQRDGSPGLHGVFPQQVNDVPWAAEAG